MDLCFREAFSPARLAMACAHERPWRLIRQHRQEAEVEAEAYQLASPGYAGSSLGPSSFTHLRQPGRRQHLARGHRVRGCPSAVPPSNHLAFGRIEKHIAARPRVLGAPRHYPWLASCTIAPQAILVCKTKGCRKIVQTSCQRLCQLAGVAG